MVGAGAVVLALGDGVVVLGLQGGPELEAGGEEGAGLTDALEGAVEVVGPAAAAVPEEPVVLAGEPGHVRTEGVGR